MAQRGLLLLEKGESKISLILKDNANTNLLCYTHLLQFRSQVSISAVMSLGYNSKDKLTLVRY